MVAAAERVDTQAKRLYSTQSGVSELFSANEREDRAVARRATVRLLRDVYFRQIRYFHAEMSENHGRV